jgi:hypothetical protein
MIGTCDGSAVQRGELNSANLLAQEFGEFDSIVQLNVRVQDDDHAGRAGALHRIAFGG